MVKGRHIFQGYIFDKDKTNEALEEDGWMRTGDVGYTDKDGYVYITGRIKVSF
jgi:long-subunit acyl-CoA synthetase (AMP-forming)